MKGFDFYYKIWWLFENKELMPSNVKLKFSVLEDGSLNFVFMSSESS